MDGHRLFHAGDLSDWQMPREEGINRKMQGDYLAALRHIRERFEDGFDVAMLPVDPRLEANAWHINIQKNNAVFCVKTQKYRRFLSKYLLLSKKNCNFAHNLAHL